MQVAKGTTFTEIKTKISNSDKRRMNVFSDVKLNCDNTKKYYQLSSTSLDDS